MCTNSCLVSTLKHVKHMGVLPPDGEGFRGKAYYPCLKEQWVPIPVHHKKSQPTRRPPIPDTVDTPKATVILPYVQHVSESIRRILTPLEIRTSFKPHRTLRQLLVHPKDLIPLLQKLGIVLPSALPHLGAPPQGAQESSDLRSPNSSAIANMC